MFMLYFTIMPDILFSKTHFSRNRCKYFYCGTIQLLFDFRYVVKRIYPYYSNINFGKATMSMISKQKMKLGDSSDLHDIKSGQNWVNDIENWVHPFLKCDYRVKSP